MSTSKGEHTHCFCTANTGGMLACCRCGKTPCQATTMKRVVKALTWADRNLGFVNSRRTR